MNLKTWMPLALAVVLGLVAAKVARDSLARTRGPGQAQGKSVRVVVAKLPVAPGQELTAEALALAPIAAEAPPPGAFTDVAAVAGRVAATALFQGQPLMEGVLAPRGAGSGLQALVPRGMRAITIEVNETSGLAGMITPGCHVDVVSTITGANRDDTMACTIVQDVLVQACGTRMVPGRGEEKDGQPVRSVTLIATPRDAEAIELASSTGRTRLVLRGAADREIAGTTGVSYVALRGEDEKPPVVAVTTPPVTIPTPATKPVDPFGGEDPRPRRTVVLIRGGNRSEVTFDEPGKAPGSNQAVTSTNEPVERN